VVKFKLDDDPPRSIAKDLPKIAAEIVESVGGTFDNYSDLWNDASRLERMGSGIKVMYNTDLRGLGDDTFQVMVCYAFCLGQWGKDGFNIFDVTHSLMTGLLLTAPSDDVAFPNLPFRSFHIRIPPEFIPLYVWSDDVLVTRWATRLTVNQFDQKIGDVLKTFVRIECGDMTGQIPNFCFLLNKGLFVSCADAVKDLEGFVAKPEEPNPYVGSTTVDDHLTQQLAILTVANLCGWLDSVGGLAGKKPDNEVARSKPSRDGDPKIAQWIVGREVKLQSELIQSAKDRVLGLDPKKRTAGWRLSRRHTIRGHLRWQVCGPKFSSRKRIWIPPHWHGPPAGDVAAHVYKLRVNKKDKV
jgi:hypothetical protein